MIQYKLQRMGTDSVRLFRLLDGEIEAEILPGASLEIREHSPTGFEMGYGGSGPAQSALAITLDYLTRHAVLETPPASSFRVAKRALTVYQDFKRDFVQGAEGLLVLDDDRIAEWLAEAVPKLEEWARGWWGPEAGPEPAPPGPADQYRMEIDPSEP